MLLMDRRRGGPTSAPPAHHRRWEEGGAADRLYLSCPIWTKQPVAHYSEGLSPPIFSISGVRPPYFLSAGVYPVSQDATPPTPPPSFSYAVMNDHWPSHWQPGSWCHIITVSPFRQNYQITSVLKRPGRLTGRPTKETQISKKRRTLKTPWILTDRRENIFFFFPGLGRPSITAKELHKSRGSFAFANIDAKHLVSPSCFSCLSLFSGHRFLPVSASRAGAEAEQSKPSQKVRGGPPTGTGSVF